MEQTVVIIAGPTAIGKTALSIRLAQHFNTSILSADSRQCYQEMSIGTAKPSAEELAMIPHFFIDSHSIHQSINAADYEQLALQYLETIFEKSPVAIVCGGTGLYIKALLEGIDEMPEVDKLIEEKVKQSFTDYGIEWLQKELQIKDPIFFAQAEQQNPVRLIRALAFFDTNGVSITTFKKGVAKQRPFKVVKIALDMPRAQLYERINHRVDVMMEQGLMAEVNNLYPLRTLKNLQTVGYSEFYDAGTFPLSELVLNQAIEKVKQHTRNYAKRQLTWFRKDTEYTWFAPDDYDGVWAFVNSKLY